MAANQDQIFDEQSQEATINEEYKIWKKNAPFLYDLAISHPVEWPSLTVQWLPKKETPPGQDYSIHKLIIGTNTGDNEMNSLMIAKVRLPRDSDVQQDPSEYKQNEPSGIGKATGESRIEIDVRINHEGEVNRARYMPQKSNIIATFTTKGEIHIFDYIKHPSQPSNNLVKPDLKLVGHQKEGFGMSWSEQKLGHLLTGDYDGKLCIWDVETNAPEPKQTFQANNLQIEDVCWHRYHPDIFGSCGDDRHVRIWDTRKPQPLSDIQTHAGDIYCLDFNPFNEYFFITGSEDKRINLFDMRNTEKPLHTFESHGDQILSLKWSPHNMKIFVSSSADRRCMIWDFGRCGRSQTPEEAQDGPPELLFVHGGHRSKVSDLDWNLNEKYIISSVEDNNILQVWQLGAHIYQE
ncbi:unnamed protein product [Paramecium pentaurelia]|uniref:Histone-binding protein RBBP4-like N-terminal domain-containing protein n=1 Tax=Paramecium pentaurelia TaxID=43138 RepID=A0A8S1WLQ4_9CILI|nr:unnamed protein product [Paramecium pentaurelia]